MFLTLEARRAVTLTLGCMMCELVVAPPKSHRRVGRRADGVEIGVSVVVLDSDAPSSPAAVTITGMAIVLPSEPAAGRL